MDIPKFSIIFDQLMNLTEETYDAIFNFINENSYFQSKEGINDYIASTPFIVEYRSNLIPIFAQISKSLFESFSDDKKVLKEIKSSIFDTLFHSEIATNDDLRACSRAYFLRCLYDIHFYNDIFEVANLIHNFWETNPKNKTPLIALFVWFAPELDSINNSFLNTLYKIAQKELYSRRLVKPFIPFVENFEEYQKDKWKLFYLSIGKENENNKENEDDGHNENENEGKKSKKVKKNQNKKNDFNEFFKNALRKDSIEELIAFDLDENVANRRITADPFGHHWFLQHNPTFLQYAVFFGSVECVNYMVGKQGKDCFTAKDDLGHSVVDFAGAGGNNEILEILKKYDQPIEDSIKMATCFHRNHFLCFLCRKYEINLESVLDEVSESNNFEILKMIFDNLNENRYINQNLNNNLNSLNNDNNNYINDSNNSNINHNNSSDNKIKIGDIIKKGAKHGSYFILLFFLPNKQLILDSGDISDALLIATGNGHLRFVEILLNNLNIDINIKSKETGKTPIQIAVENSNYRIAKCLISIEKIDLSILQQENQRSLLHIAVINNSFKIAKYLLKCSRFDVNSVDKENATALHYASRNVNTIGTHLVIDVSIFKDDFDNTDENYIFNYSKLVNFRMFKLFAREKRVNFDVFDKSGFAPLHYIARNGRIDYLIELRNNRPTGVNYRVRTLKENKTPLHFSAENDRFNCVFFFVSQDDETQKDQDINGQTPLHRICAAGLPDSIRSLAEKAEFVNIKDKWNRTALQICASKGRTGCIRQMAQLEGIDLNSPDNNGNTALRLANDHNHYLSSQLLEIVNAKL